MNPCMVSPRRRGAVLVEFAILLPVLVAIVLGCVDFGRFAYTYIAVSNAARAGAFFASTQPVDSKTWNAWVLAVQQASVNEMSVNFTASQISVPTPVMVTDSNGLKTVQVQVSYPFETIVNWPGMPHRMTLRHAVAMRVIR